MTGSDQFGYMGGFELMKITETAPTRPAVLPSREPAVASANNVLSSDLGVAVPNDSAMFMGIPETELTPKVRNAIVVLTQEVENLRGEVERANSHLAQVERLADEDALVPIRNRRAFMREMSRVISYNERYNAVSSLIYFDLNNFKEINDKFGHAMGDVTLMHAANSLINNLRASDLLGRLGGDEFGVILNHTNAERAQLKGRDLARAIQATPVEYGNSK
ncbi:uncharacterized protein METZ01_LOCUS477522, partial [marine metagenome]